MLHQVLLNYAFFQIDYPDMAVQHSGGETTRPHAMRRAASAENTMQLNDIETSSSEVQ